MRMKRVLLLCVCLYMGVAHAQDVIVTASGDFVTAYDVEVGGSSVFYKLDPTADTSHKISKADVVMIKRKDGQVERFDTAPAQPAKATAAFGVNPNQEEDNLKLGREFNSHDPVYTADDTDKKASAVMCVLGLQEGSIIETPELKASFAMKKKYIEHHLKSDGWSAHYTKDVVNERVVDPTVKQKGSEDSQLSVIVVTLTNKTDKPVYVDLANSFILLSGNATPFYEPTVTTTVSTKAADKGVSLGAIAGALGMGGAIKSAANEVTLGGSNGSSTTKTTYSQRIVSIPPKASLALPPQSIGQGMIHGREIEYKDDIIKYLSSG